nr:reverse transcriptase domain-containing protein [Tanacetum cinerariifolium]
MRTRSSSNLIVESFTIPKGRNQRRSKQIVEPDLRIIVETPVANMEDTRSMFKLLQAPTEGYRDAIVIPAILAEDFKLNFRLLQLVTSSQYHGFERDDPHAHIRWFNNITSMLKYKNVPNDAIKLMLFPFSLEGAARTWLEKEPLRFDETFSEAWDHFKDLLHKCPHYGFLEFHQIDTFYNALTQFDQDSLNATTGVVSKVNTTTSSSPSSDITALTDIVKELELMKKANQQAFVKAIKETCDVKAITTRSGIAYDGPMIPPTPSPLLKELERETKATKDKKLSLPDLTPTCMTLELATRSYAYPAGIAEDVFVQVGKFTFPADFIIFDYDVDPGVPLILGRPFYRTARDLVDHGNESINMINFIDITCEDRFLEVLKIKKSNHPSSGSTTPLSDSSPGLIPFETSDSLLKEFNFTNEPPLDYLPPPGDDDDLFNLKSDNDKWKKLLYGDGYKDIDSENDKNKDSKIKSLVVEAHIIESNDLVPQLLDSDLTLPEELYEIATLSSSPFGNEDKIPYGESKVHIEVLSVLWGNRPPIHDGLLPLS